MLLSDLLCSSVWIGLEFQMGWSYLLPFFYTFLFVLEHIGCQLFSAVEWLNDFATIEEPGPPVSTLIPIQGLLMR